MTINLTPQAVAGPVPAGARGDPGLYPSAAWAAINYAKNSVVAHLNCVWRANVTTAQEPAVDGSGAVSSSDWDLWIDGRGTAVAGGYAASALASKNAAATALTTMQATVHALSTLEMPPAANDAAALAWAAAQTPVVTPVTGSRYWNTTEANFRVWNATSSTFGDEDSDAQTQRSNAAASAGAAAASASTATTQAGISTTQAGIATTQAGIATTQAGIATTQAGNSATSASAASGSASTATTQASAASGSASAAAGSATAADNSNSTVQAALLNTVSYAAVAQASAATATAATGLSILAAAQRSIKLTTFGNSACPYDATKDDDGGAWIKKSTTQSYLSDTLNTATRGTVAPMPLQSAIIGEPTILSVFSNVDGTGSLWKSWTVAGLTCVAAKDGWIAYGGTGGQYLLDLIADLVYQRTASALNVCTNQNISTYNQGTATWALVSSAGAIASATVNSIALTTAPNTPLNPLRYGLPNPTVAVGTASGESVFRWDATVVNSASTTAVISTSFDIPASPQIAPNLWTLTSAGVNVTNQYQSASWVVAGLTSFTAAQLGVGTLAKVTSCGPGMVAVAGSTGLARIKLDPTNPANSLINIKTTTYDTGWMVLGKTVLALAESSANLATLTASGELITHGSFDSGLTGWAQPDGTIQATVSAGVCTLSTTDLSAASHFAEIVQAITCVIGQTYRVKAIVGGSAVAITASAIGGNNQEIMTTYAGVGAQTATFVATATTMYIGFYATGNSSTASVTAISSKIVDADRAGSGNHLDVVGAVTRTVVASGADTAAYGGFSASNFFRLSQVAAINMGSTDFAVMCPITLPSTGAYSTICHYTDETGASYGGAAYWFLRAASDGTLSAVLYDGANIASVTTTAVVPTSGVHNVGFARRGSYGEWYLDGVRVARTSLGSVGSVTNTSANLLIGASYYNSAIIYPAVGKIGKLRVFNYAPTPDQFAFMMADQAPVNVANAQTLLTGASVQGVAFDPDTNQLAAPNSTAGCDVFSGSVRVANYNSATGSTNLLPNAQLPSAWTYTRSSLGNLPSSVSAATWPGGIGWALVEDATASSTHIAALAATPVLANATAYAVGIPLAAGGRGYAKLTLSGAVAASAFVNLATGVVSNTTNCAGLSPVALSGGGFEVGLSFTSSSAAALTVTLGGATGTTTGNDSYSGTSAAALYFGKPQVNLGSTLTTYVDGLSNSVNAKAAAFAGGKLAVVTAAGADVWIPSADGLRAINDAVGSSRRPFYDPTTGRYYGRTTDATPTVVLNIPIPEGKGGAFEIVVEGLQTAGTATERDMFVAEGSYSRDIGGNVTVDATTRAIKQVTGTTAATAAADTTNQTIKVTVTGKAATTMIWSSQFWALDSGLASAV